MHLMHNINLCLILNVEVKRMMNQMNELLLLYLFYELLKKNLNIYDDDDDVLVLIDAQNFGQVQMMILVLNNDYLNHHCDIL